jgi:hypothetical protein
VRFVYTTQLFDLQFGFEYQRMSDLIEHIEQRVAIFVGRVVTRDGTRHRADTRELLAMPRSVSCRYIGHAFERLNTAQMLLGRK